MFGEECTLPMDIGLPKQQLDLPDSITSPMQFGFGTLWRWPMTRCGNIPAKQCSARSDYMTVEQLNDSSQ